MRQLVAVLTLALLFAHSSVASAQPGPRELYESGVGALESEDSERALELFREAFSLNPEAEFAVALAATLQERALFTEAIQWYDRLLSGNIQGLTVSQRVAVESARTAASEQQGILELTAVGREELRVEVDGDRVGSVSPGITLTLRLDPTEHEVTASAGDRRGEVNRLSLRSGQTRRVSLRVPLPDVELTTSTLTPPPVSVRSLPEDEESSSALPWVLGGVAVLVVVGAIAAVLLVTGGSSPGFQEGPFETVEALRQP